MRTKPPLPASSEIAEPTATSLPEHTTGGESRPGPAWSGPEPAWNDDTVVLGCEKGADPQPEPPLVDEPESSRQPAILWSERHNLWGNIVGVFWNEDRGAYYLLDCNGKEDSVSVFDPHGELDFSYWPGWVTGNDHDGYP